MLVGDFGPMRKLLLVELHGCDSGSNSQLITNTHWQQELQILRHPKRTPAGYVLANNRQYKGRAHHPVSHDTLEAGFFRELTIHMERVVVSRHVDESSNIFCGGQIRELNH